MTATAGLAPTIFYREIARNRRRSWVLVIAVTLVLAALGAAIGYTGRDPRHASVAVTTGLLAKLDREELQGVIAHEMSHMGHFEDPAVGRSTHAAVAPTPPG